MSDEHTANIPIELPEVLQQELDSFGTSSPPIDLTKPAEQRLREVHERIRALQPERSALCLSGGGIRSATFALGVVQTLAKKGLLTKFDYLSTVSGGGYLGSMLSAWIHSHPRKLAGVADDLAGRDTAGQPAPEVRPLRHLREFSNYIAPKLGLFSADGWTLVATALRNLLLNWTVLVLLLAGLLVLPWLGLLGVLAIPTAGQLDALLAAAFVCIAAATAYPGLDLPSQGCFRWRQKWFVAGWLGPLVAGILCLAAWWAGRTNSRKGAVEWMQDGSGKWCIAGFLVAASVAGILACTVITVIRDLRRGESHLRFSRARTAKIAGMILASIAVIGTPGTALLWLMAVKVFPAPASAAVPYLTCAPAALLFGFFLLNSLFVGVTSRCSDDDDREWFARAAGWLGAVVVGWLVVHGLVFWLPQWVEIHLGPAVQASVAASGGLVGFIAAKIGASAKSPAFLENNPAAKKNLLLGGAALLFFALLACGVSLLLDRGFFVQSMLEKIPEGWRAPATAPDTAAVPTHPPDPWLTMLYDRTSYRRFGLLLTVPEVYLIFGKKIALALLSLIGGGLVMGYFVNVNRFSLHATYRNRLVRAYLGAARAEKRRPHPFTGFDPDDNFDIAALDHPRPLHVVNMTLNLVGGDELAWQERQADSFTATRLHCGNSRLGYRPSGEYSHGLSLGTALAISGAAASPNQGYNSSPLLTFLMTLFNVRLGWWLGNPGLRGSHAWKNTGPAQATFPLFIEALGLTNERRAYVNLSDGGHFENLAIYEMLRRRCRYLVVIDAECDPGYAFDGLGGIVRKARVDLGIPIHFLRHRPEAIKKTRTAPGSPFALGVIDYQKADPAAENGLLLYLKPVLLGGEPTDVQHYAKTSKDFPHESTSDQFFSESQFESYRALGAHEMAKVLESLANAPATIAELCTHLRDLELPGA